MNLAEKIISISLLFAAVSCANETPAPQVVQAPPVVIPTTKIVDHSCDWVKIITVSSKDILTPETANQILIHDRAVVKNCPNVKPGG